MRPEAAGPAGPGLAVEWAAPACVGAFMSTREGGRSLGPWAGWNLGDHVGDDAQAVADHRAAFARVIGACPVWLRQVHGVRVVDAARATGGAEPADAAFAAEPGVACTVQVADCLPVLVARADGGLVGAAHAGWRGLSGGVLPTLLEAMHTHDPEAARQGIHLWLGPCIGPSRFEVGPEVQTAFAQSAAFCDVDVKPFFRPGQGDRQLADLSGLARAQCLAWAERAHVPIRHMQQDRRCTVTDAAHFYSYRREGRTGRMAAMIWRKPEDSSRVFI